MIRRFLPEIISRQLPLRWRLRLERGITDEEFRDFHLATCDAAFRDNFLGEQEQRRLLNYLNPRKYYILARNKYLSHLLFTQGGIRRAPLYACYIPEGRFAAGSDIATDCAGVCALLQRKGVKRFMVKPVENSHGDDVYLVENLEFTNRDARLFLSSGEQKDLSKLLGDSPLVFEGVVSQTAQFAAFNPSSVNTVRFMTALYPDGDVKIIATFIKIGRAGRWVDNAGGGGNVDVAIDVASGRLEHAILFEGWDKVTDIDVHPDTGARLNGVVIDNWAAVKEEVKDFQRAFPYCKVGGWDIALTDEGPLAIEVNDFWDRTGQLFIRRGWRREVRDCYDAWKKTGRKYIFGRKLR